MGAVKHTDNVRRVLGGTPVFSAGDVARLVGDKRYAHVLLHNLVKQGELYRIMKGWYSWEDDPTLAVFCFRPAYIGLQAALSEHNLWEQETNPVIVTTRRVRTGERSVFGQPVIVHTIDPQYFFGFSLLDRDGYMLPVSNPEKTLIDLVYFNETPGTDIMEQIKERIDEETLSLYLERYPSGISV